MTSVPPSSKWRSILNQRALSTVTTAVEETGPEVIEAVVSRMHSAVGHAVVAPEVWHRHNPAALPEAIALETPKSQQALSPTRKSGLPALANAIEAYRNSKTFLLVQTLRPALAIEPQESSVNANSAPHESCPATSATGEHLIPTLLHSATTSQANNDARLPDASSTRPSSAEAAVAAFAARRTLSAPLNDPVRIIVPPEFKFAAAAVAAASAKRPSGQGVLETSPMAPTTSSFKDLVRPTQASQERSDKLRVPPLTSPSILWQSAARAAPDPSSTPSITAAASAASILEAYFDAPLDRYSDAPVTLPSYQVPPIVDHAPQNDVDAFALPSYSTFVLGDGDSHDRVAPVEVKSLQRQRRVVRWTSKPLTHINDDSSAVDSPTGVGHTSVSECKSASSGSASPLPSIPRLRPFDPRNSGTSPMPSPIRPTLPRFAAPIVGSETIPLAFDQPLSSLNHWVAAAKVATEAVSESIIDVASASQLSTGYSTITALNANSGTKSSCSELHYSPRVAVRREASMPTLVRTRTTSAGRESKFLAASTDNASTLPNPGLHNAGASEQSAESMKDIDEIVRHLLEYPGPSHAPSGESRTLHTRSADPAAVRSKVRVAPLALPATLQPDALRPDTTTDSFTTVETSSIYIQSGVDLFPSMTGSTTTDSSNNSPLTRRDTSSSFWVASPTFTSSRCRHAQPPTEDNEARRRRRVLSTAEIATAKTAAIRATALARSMRFRASGVPGSMYVESARHSDASIALSQ